MATVKNTIALNDKMTPVLRSIIRALNSTVDALASVDKVSDKAFEGVKRDVRNANNAVNNLNLDIQDLQKPVQNARAGFSGWQAAIVTANQGLQLVRSTMDSINKLTGYADRQSGITSRLTLMTGSLEEAKELQDKIMASANRARASYTATADSVAQMGMMAADAFTQNGVLNTDELVAFTEAINKQLVISGAAGTAGADAALYQLSQAMASGTLRGDELRSVMEQAPVIADTIAKYMGVSKGELRELAAEGMVTSEIVKNAMLSSLEETTAQFSSMPITFGQAMTMLKNEAIRQSQPLVKQFSSFMQSDTFQKMFQGAMALLPQIFAYIQRIGSALGSLASSPGAQALAQDLNILAGVLGWILEAIVNIGVFFVSNWGYISPIIWTIVAAYLAYNAALLVHNGILAIQNIREKIAEIQKYRQAKAAIAHATALGVEASATHAATVAQAGFNTAMLASPITWIIAAIIAVIAVIILVINWINQAQGTTTSALGVILGAIMFVVAAVWNIIVGVINAILQIVWNMISPFISIIEFIANAFGDGFNGIGGMAANLFGQLIAGFLDLAKIVTPIIDAIFGTDWTGKLDRISTQVRSWGKNENAITIDRTAPTLQSLTGGAVDRWDYGDAYNKGYGMGEKAEESLSSALKGFDLDQLSSQAEELAKQQGDLTDMAGGSGGGLTVQGEVSITDEDIKLLKDVAAAEWVNKYTTLRPELTVTFGDVHETADAGKILSAIETMVEEAYASTLTGG